MSITYQQFKLEYRLNDDGDKWGTAMQALFDIAAELWERTDGAYPPEHWQYRPSPIAGDQRELESAMYEVCLMADTETLVRFGNVLNRYTDCLRNAGMDY
jgi:hypothetical protein